VKFLKNTLLKNSNNNFVYQTNKRNKNTFGFFAERSIEDIINQVYHKECT